MLKAKTNKVDFLKIDVEGFESNVLRGAKKILRRDHPKVLFEAWDKNYLKKVEKELKPFNYNIKKIDSTNYLAT